MLGANGRKRTGLQLNDVLDTAKVFGDPQPLPLTSCCANARQCRPGDIFVAVLDAEHDGHNDATEAVRRGAIAVVAEQVVPVQVPVILVEDTRVAFGQICQAISGNPTDQLKLIGVAGTYGKTTTELLITSILEAAGKDMGVIGSLGYCDGVNTAGGPRKTPSTAELADWLSRMVTHGSTHGVIEMDASSLARRALSGVNLEAAVITNIRRASLNEFGSLLNYRKAIARIVDNLVPGGACVLNADDPASQRLLDTINGPVLTFGIHKPAEIRATIVERHLGEQTFLLSAGNETVPVRTQLIGDHHVHNCLAAAATGLLFGCDLTTIARGLEFVKELPGRMELLRYGQSFGVFVDQANSPESLALTLKTLRQVTRGRLICACGADFDRDHDERPLLGRAMERNADVPVVTSGNIGYEEPLQMAHDILDGFKRPSTARVMPNRARAIEWAVCQAREGDIVLIAGSAPALTCGENGLSDKDVAVGCLRSLQEEQNNETASCVLISR